MQVIRARRISAPAPRKSWRPRPPFFGSSAPKCAATAAPFPHPSSAPCCFWSALPTPPSPRWRDFSVFPCRPPRGWRTDWSTRDSRRAKPSRAIAAARPWRPARAAGSPWRPCDMRRRTGLGRGLRRRLEPRRAGRRARRRLRSGRPGGHHGGADGSGGPPLPEPRPLTRDSGAPSCGMNCCVLAASMTKRTKVQRPRLSSIRSNLSNTNEAGFGIQTSYPGRAHRHHDVDANGPTGRSGAPSIEPVRHDDPAGTGPRSEAPMKRWPPMRAR